MQNFNLLSLAIIVTFINLIRSQSIEINSQCIDCICQATERCRYPLGCSNVGSGYYCGPLQISWNYWSDGGKLGDLGNKHDFEDCLTTKSCAEQTVRNYMRKYGQDCNGDGVITCDDFAILHKTGYRQCKQSAIENTKYWTEFTNTKCYRSTENSQSIETINCPIRWFAMCNVRRTISNGPNNHPNTINERMPDLRGFSRNTFKELENIENLHKNLPSIAFDNFDSMNHEHPTTTHSHHFNNNPTHNTNNNHNHNELTIETSSRIGRPIVHSMNVINRNNNFNNRKPLNSIRPLPNRSNGQPDSSTRAIAVNENILKDQPESENNLKFSNATVTIDGKCLDCICYGSTKCNLNMKCSGNFCGPYLISYAYWQEGGKLLNNYVNCANDFNCAKQTVANYMARHNRDCDLNRELTCDDFAIIHQTGGYECEKNSKQIKKSHYYMNFEKCYFNDDFHVFVNDDDSVTGYSIISKPATVSSVNQINPPINNNPIVNNRPTSLSSNQPRHSIPTEVNLTNDWRPIEPFNRNNNDNNLANVRNSFRQPNNIGPTNNQPPVNRPSSINQPPPLINSQPPVNIRPIIVSNNKPDWSDENPANGENSEASVNDDNSNNNNQPLNRSTRRPLIRRPPPRAFENNEEEINEQPNVEPPNSNANSYSPINNSNSFEQPAEIVPVENNHRRTSARAAALTVSNVIPVNPGNPIITSLSSTNKNNITISQSCFDCICEATSSRTTCSDRTKCTVNNFGELVCGPYQLNRFFWLDSGKMNDNSEADAFEQCTSDRICAQSTIAAYMQKHAVDCDQDGEINCIDYAAMVKAGHKACTLQNLIDSSYWNRFQSCYGFGDE